MCWARSTLLAGPERTSGPESLRQGTVHSPVWVYGHVPSSRPGLRPPDPEDAITITTPLLRTGPRTPGPDRTGPDPMAMWSNLRSPGLGSESGAWEKLEEAGCRVEGR